MGYFVFGNLESNLETFRIRCLINSHRVALRESYAKHLCYFYPLSRSVKRKSLSGYFRERQWNQKEIALGLCLGQMRSFGGLLVICWCCLGSDCHSKRLLSCKRVKRESWGRKAFYLLFYLAVGEIKVNSGVQILQRDSARLLLSSLVL